MTSIKATFQDETRRRRLENVGGPEEERECFESMFPVLKGQDFEVELIRTKDDLKVFKVYLSTLTWLVLLVSFSSFFVFLLRVLTEMAFVFFLALSANQRAYE